MSLHYLVKVSSCFVSEQQLELQTQKHTKCFCHVVYKTRSILIKFCTYGPEIYLPQTVINVFHLT